MCRLFALALVRVVTVPQNTVVAAVLWLGRTTYQSLLVMVIPLLLALDSRQRALLL
jgi:hypothetical protein